MRPIREVSKDLWPFMSKRPAMPHMINIFKYLAADYIAGMMPLQQRERRTPLLTVMTRAQG
jgi:hypothetical protein